MMGPLRILLVDDDNGVREVLAAFLRIDGHQVQTAEDGAEGLQTFLAGEFDLVITDKALPGMSGDRLAAEVKKASPRTPVMLLSGYNAGGEDEIIPGVDVIATKPIMIEDLRIALQKAVEAGRRLG